MLITELVRSRGHLLTATDRRLTAVLQLQPAEASYWFAADLTGPLGLHQSAATRLAQRLGFDGYPQLRDALRRDYLAGDGPSQRLRGRLERRGADDVLAGFVDDELTALAALPRLVTQEELDLLAERITGAGHVHLFGHGNATVLVDLLSRRLTRFGVRTTALTGSRRDLAEGLSTLHREDLLLAFAFRRPPSVLAPLLQIVRDAGAHSALITDTLLTLSPAPDSVLAAPRGGSDEFLSLTVPMALVNALVLTIARRAPEPMMRSLDQLGHLLERLEP